VGQKAPVFSAVDADSNIFYLQKALENGSVVLIFYRGFWCPVCNKHLGSLQDNLRLIENTGAKVIAVSPEKPEFLDKMALRTGAQFTLLYDEGYRIAKAYDVVYKHPPVHNCLLIMLSLAESLKRVIRMLRNNYPSRQHLL